MSSITHVCVFCGAQPAVGESFLSTGRQLGARMAEDGLAVVYGGGASGVMGAVADGALEQGGKVIGIFPKHLDTLEQAHPGISEMVWVESMHARKWEMFRRSQAVTVLPGGFGTLDEFFEVLTWKQLGLHERPIILLNQAEYWTPLLNMMKQMVQQKFVHPKTAALFEIAETLDELMQALERGI